MYLEIHNIHKTWESVTVDFDLGCAKGEMVCLLGPSGSGKSTVLNIIAGLEENDKGYDCQIVLDEKRIEKLAPAKREIGMVFQSGALFNHMNVCDNVAYGLISKGIDKKSAYKKASDYLKYFELEGFEKRQPQSLSGGERQRVALARTLICQPKLVLLDEPFSALDAPLRRSLAVQLRQWQTELGFTAIMVTHDETEAQQVSDKLVFMKK